MVVRKPAATNIAGSGTETKKKLRALNIPDRDRR
jgi:hypothetical protein